MQYHHFQTKELYTLPETFSSHLKMDGWKKMILSFPFGAKGPVSGAIFVLWRAYQIHCSWMSSMGQNRLTHGLVFIFIFQAEVDGFLVDMVQVKMTFPRLFQTLKSSSTCPRFRPKLSVHRMHLTSDDFAAFDDLHARSNVNRSSC